MTRDDFRIRKTRDGFRVWQRVGSGWERLSDVYPTPEDARAWIADVLKGWDDGRV